MIEYIIVIKYKDGTQENEIVLATSAIDAWKRFELTNTEMIKNSKYVYVGSLEIIHYIESDQLLIFKDVENSENISEKYRVDSST